MQVHLHTKLCTSIVRTQIVVSRPLLGRFGTNFGSVRGKTSRNERFRNLCDIGPVTAEIRPPSAACSTEPPQTHNKPVFDRPWAQLTKSFRFVDWSAQKMRTQTMQVHLHTKLCTCIVFVRILTFAHKIWLRFKSRLGCFLNSLIWVPPSPTRANKWWLVCGNQGFIYQLRTVIYQDDCCYLSLLSVAGGAVLKDHVRS